MSVSLAIAFIFCVIFARFFYLQVVYGATLVIKATDQWNREIPVIAVRGTITDANGSVLAGNINTYSVFVRPNAVTNAEYAAIVLAGIFGLEITDVKSKLIKKGVSEITLAKHVSEEQIRQLITYDIDGVYYARDNTRTYTYGDVLCQVLGFTSSDGNGISGLEKYYNSLLAGSDGEILYATDIVGIETENNAIVYSPAADGASIALTVDIDIQLAAEQALKEVYLSSGAKSVSCVVLDPQNFDVLAMVNYPSYDLNDVPRDDTETLNELSRNAVVCDIYEPGSTFKVITAAADIEEYLQGNANAFSTSHIFSSSRTRTVDGTTIKCWSDHSNGKHSNQTLADALNNSCNPCFTDIALSLGSKTFYKYLTAFGFGNVTGIDFSGEAVGMLLNESAVRDCDLARIGFGQSVAVTQIQLACAVAAAVNGGNYYVPRLVKSITDANGNTTLTDTVLKNKVISGEASSILAEMLEGVVTEGSGKKAYIKGYK
ncbi:MAG: hypothetical protein LUI60_01875, partial [Clostridia bacterium]|nr:hypothetical protein [Clostridia bacterium]